MLQSKEIGKKRDWNSSRVGRKFVSPKGREYTYASGQRGIVVLEYKGERMQVKTKDYKSADVDTLLEAMEREISKNK